MDLSLPNTAGSHRAREMISRTIIVDPAICGASGHHLFAARAVSYAAKALGYQPVWLAHQKLSSTLVPEYVDFVPTFSSTIYENQIGLLGRALRPLIGDRKILRKGLRERPWEIKLHHRISSKMLMGDRRRELIRAMLNLKATAADSIIVPTADSQTVDMLTSWCGMYPRQNLPLIHIRTCWSEANMPFADYAGGFSRAVIRLAAVSRQLTLSAETEEAAKLWSGKTKLNFDVWQCIVDATQLPETQKVPPQKPVVVAWLGEPRAEKGTGILPDIIERVLAGVKPGDVQFLLQGSGRSSRRAREFDAKLSKFGDAIVRLPVGLAPSSYASALEQTGILLLPYDPACYPKSRGSGIAVEGLLSAKPMVATRGTFAGSLITCGNGVIGSDVDELASGILQIISNFERFQLGALAAREKAVAKYDVLSAYRRMLMVHRPYVDASIR